MGQRSEIKKVRREYWDSMKWYEKAMVILFIFLIWYSFK